ncbi:MAG TPA: pilus assembly protein TadG-related protein [Candidatus Eisenbacteria bacterium]|nr:pilus assembly protein TadG-related protein [Candidatus Eisenbacteria bacterium]
MNPTTEQRHEQRRPDEGIAVIWVAVFLLVSLWFVSLAIDMGKLMAAKTELQAAADAAALAGVSSVNLETGEVVQDSARVRAAAVAGQNSAYEGTQTPTVIDPIGDVSFPAANRVRVVVRREAATGNPVLTHFAQTLGIQSLSVNADATAEVRLIGEPCEHLAPFAPQDVPPTGFETDCSIDYVLKDGSGSGPNSGNFQLLDYPPCPESDFTGGGGAAVYQYTRYGYDCCLDIGQEMVWTEPGNKVGPFRAALQDRFDEDTDKRQGICYDDYAGNGKRIFITPIVESFDVNGKKLVRIVKFAAFFLKDRPSGSMVTQGVRGQFINYVVPGNGGPNPPPDSKIYGIHLVE